MNQFGGDWTKHKINILVEYAHAYMTIMNVHAAKYNWKLLYFDGFAGSGLIEKEGAYGKDVTVGAARRIVEMSDPRPFDTYYFVEKDPQNAILLSERTKDSFPTKNIEVKQSDCNDELRNLASFLNSVNGKKHKVLAYIDPCGMQLEWNSLQILKNLSVDLWILVPTGMGVNRLLVNDGNISDAWLDKLSTFLGMTHQEIKDYFYKSKTLNTLFGEETITYKEEDAINKSALLYRERLQDIFKKVTEPFILKTPNNAILYHFFMASNNDSAINIANSVIKKYSKLSF